MSWSSLLRNLHRSVSPNKSNKRQKPPRGRGFESLEDRRLFVVGAFSQLAPLPAIIDSGVVQLTQNLGGGNTRLCSGTLLSTGRHILTAAHCLTNSRGVIDSASTTVTFQTQSGTYPLNVPASQYQVHPGWNGDGDDDMGYDLAILTLPEVAPADATRYDIYRNFDEVGKTVSIVGYGRTGTGNSGATIAPDGQRRQAWNTIEGTSYDNWYQSGRGGPDGTVLWYDFDSTLGSYEGFAAPGDSGGPLFVGGRVAGVTSAGWDGFLRGKPEFEFGEDATATRVSPFADWIDLVTMTPQQIVLNMANQPGGNDGVSDRIELRKDGSNFQLLVNGRVAANTNAFAILAGMQLNGSSDNDQFVMDFTTASITISGGFGNDTLQGPDSVTAWQITGYKAGSYAPFSWWDPLTTFTSIENLEGGSSTDTFYFSPSGTITGRVDGGGGSRDALDYSQFTTSVSVNLTSGRASRISGGVRGIENVRGGSAGDFLRGNYLDNRLEGNGGNDWLFGYGGSDTLKGGSGHDRLYGGDDTDWLYGDTGNDYLDGGHTARDYLYGGQDRDTIVRDFNETLRLSTSLGSYGTYSAQPLYPYSGSTRILDSVYRNTTDWVKESQVDDYDLAEDVLVSRKWDLFGHYVSTHYDYPG